MLQKLNSEIAVIGIDIGKNSFHIVGQDRRGVLVLRQKWSRGQVESIIMPSGSQWGGVGEPTIAVAAPAVLNAIAAATGKRYRTFPLKHHGLTMA